MEFKGRIYKVMPITEGVNRAGDKWKKQEFIFEFFEHDTDRYSDKVVLSVMNDRIREYDLHEGDEVMIGFGHSVREYNGRWFNDIRLYKLEKAAKMPLFEEQAKEAPAYTEGTQTVEPIQSEGENDSLPF